MRWDGDGQVCTRRKSSLFILDSKRLRNTYSCTPVSRTPHPPPHGQHSFCIHCLFASNSLTQAAHCTCEPRNLMHDVGSGMDSRPHMHVMAYATTQLEREACDWVSNMRRMAAEDPATRYTLHMHVRNIGQHAKFVDRSGQGGSRPWYESVNNKVQELVALLEALPYNATLLVTDLDVQPLKPYSHLWGHFTPQYHFMSASVPFRTFAKKPVHMDGQYHGGFLLLRAVEPARQLARTWAQLMNERRARSGWNASRNMPALADAVRRGKSESGLRVGLLPFSAVTSNPNAISSAASDMIAYHSTSSEQAFEHLLVDRPYLCAALSQCKVVNGTPGIYGVRVGAPRPFLLRQALNWSRGLPSDVRWQRPACNGSNLPHSKDRETFDASHEHSAPETAGSGTSFRITNESLQSLPETATGCACASICRGEVTSHGTDSHLCTEAIPACMNAIKRVGTWHLALLESNPVYRVKDLVQRKGARWRLDAMTILCEPRYRGTLLRQALARSVTVDSRKLSTTLSDAEVEAQIATRAEGQVGHYQLTGHEGPSGVSLPRSLWGSLLHELRLRRGNGDCADVASPDELVVIMRLGDEVSHTAQLMKAIRSYLATHNATSESGYPSPRRAVVSGTLAFADNKLGGTRRAFAANDREVNQSLSAVRSMLSLLHKEGISARVRSETVADKDLCYYIFSPHVVGIPGRGFYGFVSSIRRAFHNVEERQILNVVHSKGPWSKRLQINWTVPELLSEFLPANAPSVTNANTEGGGVGSSAVQNDPLAEELRHRLLRLEELPCGGSHNFLPVQRLTGVGSWLNMLVNPLAFALRFNLSMLTPPLGFFAPSVGRASTPCHRADLSCVLKPLSPRCDGAVPAALENATRAPAMPHERWLTCDYHMVLRHLGGGARAASCNERGLSTLPKESLWGQEEAEYLRRSLPTVLASSPLSSSLPCGSRCAQPLLQARHLHGIGFGNPSQQADAAIPPEYALSRGHFWFKSQLLAHLLRPNELLERLVQRRLVQMGALGLGSGLGSSLTRPVLALHIRGGDACTKAEEREKARRCDTLLAYLPAVETMIRRYGFRSIFLATDDAAIAAAAAASAPVAGVRIHGPSAAELTAASASRRFEKRVMQPGGSFDSFGALQTTLADMVIMGRCDGLVGKFTSNVDRIAYSLMSARAGEPVPYISLDKSAWCHDYGNWVGASVYGAFKC